MFARLCAALSDLLAGRCCGCPPGGRLSRARAAAPAQSGTRAVCSALMRYDEISSQIQLGHAVRSRPKYAF